MRQAFGQLQDFQLVGGPDWINSDRFDIEAKLEGGGPMSPQVIAVGTAADSRGSLRAEGAPGHARVADLRAGGRAQRWPARAESQTVVGLSARRA